MKKIKKGYKDLNIQNPKPPFEVNPVHLARVNQVLTVLAAHASEISDSKEWLRDVSTVREMLKDPKSKGKGELEADDMVYLNDVWKKIKHYAK